LQVIFAPPGENNLKKKKSTMLPQAKAASGMQMSFI